MSGKATPTAKNMKKHILALRISEHGSFVVSLLKILFKIADKFFKKMLNLLGVFSSYSLTSAGPYFSQL